MIPGLVSATPIIVNIINNRSDGGGNLNIHDLYVEGSVNGYTDIGSIDMRQLRNSSFSFKVTGNSLMLAGNNSKQPAVIMDVLGKTVLTSDSRKINISSLNNGIYILKIGNFTGRFIKK